MPLFTCDVAKCGEPAVRGQGSCRLCNRHLCIQHLKKDFHTCPHWSTDEDGYAEASSRSMRQELSELFARVNTEALKAKASALRGGIPCSVPLSAADAADTGIELMGGMNYHIPITFTDNVSWLCRIRRQNTSTPPKEAQDRLLLAEVATYRFLATISVPVPKIFDFATSSPSNPVGVGYIMMERLTAKSLEWYRLDVQSKTKILHQLADIFVTLKEHPLPSIGSLKRPDNLTVGPLAGQNTFDVDATGYVHSIGPFSSALEYRRAAVEQKLDFIVRGEIFADNPVDGYLVHRYLLENIPSFARLEQSAASKFYLKHTDDKGDHILIDDSHNIVAIIDWEFAQTTTQAEAFSAPLFLLDVGAYYDGNNELSDDEKLFASILEEKGHHDLALFVRDGRREHRLDSCIGGGGGEEDLPQMFTGFLTAMRRASGTTTWQVWKEDALRKYKKDPELQRLLERD